jgi:hypothetical protein
MGSVLEFGMPKRRRPRPAARGDAGGPSVVHCGHCGEPHPIVRLQGGEQRCVTAFFDGTYWFCRNRGCRRAWLEHSGEI